MKRLTLLLILLVGAPVMADGDMIEFCAAAIAASAEMSKREELTEFQNFWYEELAHWGLLAEDHDLVVRYYDILMHAYETKSITRVEVFHSTYNCREARLGE